MSIPIDLADLPAHLTGFPSAYLLSTTDGQVKVVQVDARLVDGDLVIAHPGRGSLANVASNPVVSVLFPPPLAPAFCLIVDGTAVVEGDDVRVTPSSAILHKPAG
ncbi:MAG: pyridoxamine 5'-phosphate oxidase [Actinobacteria bacterium]|uniref:Unannotated protein n=1 Tax=freshwater metagenome TaxID=449393 RepID=A0A6J6SDC9_9ZZZZ|nr:pyridoxamine 5'-phosphate oxidase [Actinomycetota bacterium]